MGDMGGSQADLGMGLSASQLMGTQIAPIGGAGGIELVPQPKRVADIKINYARQDKKIDVKQLKRAIWKDLCLPPKVTKGPAPDGMEQPKSFQDALNLLPQDIPKVTLEQVSVPYCFVCLLHLANEKHLSLNAETLDSLIIRQTAEGSDVPQVDVGAVLFGGKRQK
jgi:condensin complex subunit 2